MHAEAGRVLEHLGHHHIRIPKEHLSIVEPASGEASIFALPCELHNLSNGLAWWSPKVYLHSVPRGSAAKLGEPACRVSRITWMLAGLYRVCQPRLPLPDRCVDTVYTQG